MSAQILPFQSAQQNNVSASPTLSKGWIKSISKASIIIESEGQIFKAQVAISCLLSPELNDLVLFSVDSDSSYILSILERHSQQRELSFPNDVNIRSEKGDITLSSPQQLGLYSAKQAQINSPELNITTNKTNMVSDSLNASINDSVLHLKLVQLFGDRFSVLIEQMQQKINHLTRSIKGTEISHIGNLIQNIRQTYNSRSDHAVITAQKDVRIDGERIHMG
jgi:hypothetical protein